MISHRFLFLKTVFKRKEQFGLDSEYHHQTMGTIKLGFLRIIRLTLKYLEHYTAGLQCETNKDRLPLKFIRRIE